VIVADTNLIGYLFLESEHSALAEQVLRRDSEWAAPLLWRSELRNVLARYVRQRALSLAASQQIMDAALDLMAGREHVVDSGQVLQLAALSGCSAYDCEFVAVAQDLGVPLVTRDRQVLRAFPRVAMSLASFAEGAA